MNNLSTVGTSTKFSQQQQQQSSSSPSSTSSMVNASSNNANNNNNNNNKTAGNSKYQPTIPNYLRGVNMSVSGTSVIKS